MFHVQFNIVVPQCRSCEFFTLTVSNRQISTLKCRVSSVLPTCCEQHVPNSADSLISRLPVRIKKQKAEGREASAPRCSEKLCNEEEEEEEAPTGCK